MRRTLLVVVVLALTLVSATTAGAKPPSMGDRTGDMDLEFNLGYPGPGGIAWIGTIEFEHGEYAIAFYFYPGHASETVSHWTEDFAIYELDSEEPCFEMEGGFLTKFECTDPLLVAHDKGMTYLKKLIWLGSGVVDEAYGPFSEWQGRNTKIKGDVTMYPFGAPHEAWGTLRFN